MHSNWPTSVTSGELGITVSLYHLGVSHVCNLRLRCCRRLWSWMSTGGSGVTKPSHSLWYTRVESEATAHKSIGAPLSNIHRNLWETEEITLSYVLKHNHIKCFPNLSWRTPSPAHFVCLPYLTHLIQLISSLVENARHDLGVSDKGEIQNVQG